MDNHKLTPNKIQRLINFAQSKSFQGVNRTLFQEFRQEYLNPTEPLDFPSYRSNQPTTTDTLPIKHIGDNEGNETSSGILDLDQCPGLDEYSLTVGSFLPGEMTGRSTGATDNPPSDVPKTTRSNMFDFGRYSATTIDDFAKKMERQTTDIQQIMRQSICSASFQSKQPDLTADEVSFAIDKAPLPVNPNQLNKEIKAPTPNATGDTSQLSYVAGYFRDRCIDFGNVFPRSDSPQYDVSAYTRPSEVSNVDSNKHTVDATLDSVPVRESRLEYPNQKDKVSQNAFQSQTPVELQTWSVKDSQMPPPSPRPLKSNHRPTALNDPTKHYLQPAKPYNDSSESELESIRISNIRNYLADNSASDLMLTDVLKLPFAAKKQPLTEINNQVSKMSIQDQVTTLKESKKTETASSASTLNTVISVKSNKENMERRQSQLSKPITSADVPLTLTQNHSQTLTRSKSPSSKSQSTVSTVQEVIGLNTPKSIDSPIMNKTEENYRFPINSALNEYRELDNSINWAEIIGSGGNQRRTDSFSQVTNISAGIITNLISGFVGVRLETVITVTTKTQNWLTAKLQFDSHPREDDIILDLPRFPTLLSPGQPENFKIQMTFKREMTTSLPITLSIKDEASETEAIERAILDVDIKMPVIQGLAATAVNRVTFPPVLEGQITNQVLILVSDCPADLQLELTIAEGNSMFFINSLQEMKKEDVKKSTFDVNHDSRKRHKMLNKLFCRLSRGHAIKVIVGFKAQKLIDLQFPNNTLSFNCTMDVHLIGVATPLKKIDLSALVGTCSLVTNVSGTLHVINGSTELTLLNNGSATGKWVIKVEDTKSAHSQFEVPLDVVEIQPGCSVNLTVFYTGPEHMVAEGKIIFEEATTGAVTKIELKGGKCPPKSFPIKANYTSISFVRPGGKELQLKNFTESKVAVRCNLIGEGFKIHGPRSSCQNVLLNFGPREIRQIPIVFQPTTNTPCAGILYVTKENEDDDSKKVYLYGCNSGDPLCWTGLVTYGDTALVRAIARQPIQFKILNRAKTPAFVAASVTFNLHFMSLQAKCILKNARCIVPGRSFLQLELCVDWSRVERILRDSAAASTSLAMITVHTGAEFTRRRILKLLKGSSDTEVNSSSLPEHLQSLMGPFDGEDTTYDNHIKQFQEHESALDELVSGLQRLIAQIDIQQELTDENTIVINDDTKYEHHTLID